MRRYFNTVLSIAVTVFGAILNWWGRIVDMFNFSEDTKAMLAWVPQFEADWGFYIFLTGLFGLTLSFVILMSKKCFQRTVETEGPKFGSSPFLPEVETKAPPLDRQPIYHAYEYLCAMKSYREGDEAERVAEDLRQAAYDREIRIWGAKKASQIEGESPHKAAISHEYWDEYGIEPILLFINPIEFPDQDLGHVRTYWDGMPEGSGQIYYYLQCDMNEIKERWSPSKVSLLDAALTAFEELSSIPPFSETVEKYYEILKDPNKIPGPAAEMLLNHADPPIPLWGRRLPKRIPEKIPQEKVSEWRVNKEATELYDPFKEADHYVEITMKQSDLVERIKKLKGED